MSGVDVLAVMQEAEAALQDFNCSVTWDKARKARAAVAELIEADLEVDEAEAECAKYPGEGSSRWLANAKAHRVAALSRVRGAE